MRTKWVLTLTVIASFSMVESGWAGKGRIPSSQVEFDPDKFVAQIDNDFFPLRPGTTFLYEGMSEDVPNSNRMTVTHETKVILSRGLKSFFTIA